MPGKVAADIENRDRTCAEISPLRPSWRRKERMSIEAAEEAALPWNGEVSVKTETMTVGFVCKVTIY